MADQQAQALRAYVVGSFQELPPSIVDDLATGKTSLLGIVRLLGEYLTGNDESLRTRAVQLLSEITIQFLDPSPNALPRNNHQHPTVPVSQIFTVQAVRTLTTFFADKLSDGVTISENFVRSSKAPEVLPDSAPRYRKNEAEAKTLQGSAMLVSCLKALTILSGCHSQQQPLSPKDQLATVKGFGLEQAHAVSDSLFSHVQANNYPQSLRYLIYRLLDSLVAHHRNSLKSFRSSTSPSQPDLIDVDIPEAAIEDEDEPQLSQAKSESCQGKPFLKGYINMVQKEKDPRNLMVLFGVDKVLLTEWEMDREMTEAFFDITFCYFPITFRPPPDDPYGITSDDLKEALRAAICASPAMAPLGYPILLEKLAAAGGPAKLDTLRTLIASTPVYGRAAAEANAVKLWEALKIEIFHATDEESCDLSCDTLTIVLHVLYENVDPPQGIAPRIVHDCLVELEQPGKSLANAAVKVLACMVKASSSTAYLAVYGFMDQMLKMFVDPSDLAMRTPILSGLGQLLEVVSNVYRFAEHSRVGQSSTRQEPSQSQSQSQSPPSDSTTDDLIGSGRLLPSSFSQRTYNGDNRPLDPFLADLLSALDNGLCSTSYTRSALLVYSSVVSISILSAADGGQTSQDHKPFLSFDELSFLTRQVSELFTSVKGDEVREEALLAIEIIANEKVSGGPLSINPSSKVIQDVVLPALFANLPDRISASTMSTTTHGIEKEQDQETLDLIKSNIRRSLGALARLCVAPHLFDAVVVKLFTKLELCCRRPTAAVTDDEESRVNSLEQANIGYARGLILTLQTLVDVKKERGHRDLAKYGATLSPKLVCLVLSGLEPMGSSAASSARLGISASTTVIADCASLLGTLVKSLDAKKQKDLVVSLNRTFCNGASPYASEIESQSLIPNTSSSLANGCFQPFLIEKPTNDFEQAQRDSVALFAAVIVACGKEAGIPTIDSEENVDPSEASAALSYLRRLLQWTLDSVASELQAKAGLWMICSCVNKFINETQPSTAVEFEKLCTDFWTSEIISSVSSDEHQQQQQRWKRKRRALQAWVWMIRGLVVKTSKQADKMLMLLIDQVFETAKVKGTNQESWESDPAWRFAKQAARSIEIVAKTDDGVATKENGFTVRLLYRHRFFTQLMPKLLEGFQNKSAQDSSVINPQKTLYLISLSSLLPYLPSQTITEQLTCLFPLLIQALDLPDPKARASAANTIMITAEVGKKINHSEQKLNFEFDVTDLVSSHLSTILKRLLDNSRFGPFATSTTRIASLQTLTSLAHTLPYSKLLPHRQTVLKTLGSGQIAIDDPKRLVRVYGVDCRDAWFSVTEKESE